MHRYMNESFAEVRDQMPYFLVDDNLPTIMDGRVSPKSHSHLEAMDVALSGKQCPYRRNPVKMRPSCIRKGANPMAQNQVHDEKKTLGHRHSPREERGQEF